MADQPEALRLANLIDHGNDSSWIEREAAAELRRLVAVNQELLEALKQALEECIWPNERLSDVHDKARAAIAKAEAKT
jgi:hypothetical protein